MRIGRAAETQNVRTRSITSDHSLGLYYAAFLYPNRAALARALRRVLDAGVPLEGAADHGVSEALCLCDPDGNGIELYFDRPREAWPLRDDGTLDMYTRPLDIAGLLETKE